MPKEKGIVMYRPRAKQFAQPMSLNDFRIRAQQYLTYIVAKRDSLENACELFGMGKEIWPDQCLRTITLIDTLSQPLAGFCRLIDTTVQLPVAVIPHRYPLAMTLHHMDEQVGELMPVVTEFRSSCRMSSEEMVRQRQHISLGLERLLAGCDDIMEKVPTLLDQARFQEKKLAKL